MSRQFDEQWRHGTPTPTIQQVCYGPYYLLLVLILVQIWKVYGPNDVTDRFRKYQWVTLSSLARPRAFLNLWSGSLLNVALVSQAEIVAEGGTARTVRASSATMKARSISVTIMSALCAAYYGYVGFNRFSYARGSDFAA